MALYPVKAPKKEKPNRKGAAFLIRRSDGAIWLQKRPAKGLLASMAQVPTTNWFDKKEGEAFKLETALDVAPKGLDFHKKLGQVTHTFTHFHLVMDIYVAETEVEIPMAEGWWSNPREIIGEALPTVFRKVVELNQ